MTAALTAEGLHTYYGKSHILHGVSLEVEEGKITALLGRNGAGKSTTLRSLMGLTPAREGKITIFGEDTTRWPTFRIAAAGVGFVPEGRRIFANLSVEENLKVPLEREGPWTIARIYQLFPRLEERKDNRGRQLSGGEQEMLSIARALLLNPKLLILDEPSQGLAPLIVREVFRIVQQMKAEGISVLLVEQNARMSLEIADNAYVLDDGIVVYSGTAAALAADEARVRSLAGASAEEWTVGNRHCERGEAIQGHKEKDWITSSRSQSSGGHSPDPVAPRNDGRSTSRPISALAGAAIEHAHLFVRHHLVKRQRFGLEVALGHMLGSKVAVIVLAANQRRPVPLPDRLFQMGRNVAHGETDAAVVGLVGLRSVKQQHMMQRSLAGR
jgi:branched-chain amino acid transport system ATP-binding protein